MIEADRRGEPMVDLARPPSALGDGAALFLDFDGTLVAIAARPDAVCVSPDLPALIQRLRDRLGGRLAIISGRALDDLDALLELPDIAASGSHGAELRWPDGTRQPVNRPVALDGITAQLHAFAADHSGTLVEAKPLGVALHHRGAPDAADACAAIMQHFAESEGFALQTGKMVHELRLPGSTKGDAVRAFMADPQFAGSVPVFVGDDVTDEEGFLAVAGFGGLGVLVGELRETAARARLDDVAAVHDWLSGLVGAGH
ncbi:MULTISPECIES: trehalose-phosphatase [unclassified Sphingomonas]|uniref:trehalose-phosphatase n=1 Tax=unclassified Sphingomonas TaxID=196159 RepID=UPI000A6D8A74|nr:MULTISPECIES: trehalose-phosphatase [unclassified Sphingomonas]